jgi:hypothetical protein
MACAAKGVWPDAAGVSDSSSDAMKRPSIVTTPFLRMSLLVIEAVYARPVDFHVAKALITLADD